MIEHTEAAVWVSPHRCGGEPCIAGTRLTTATVARMVQRLGVDAVARFYDVTREQVEVALWYEAEYGKGER